MTKGTPGFDPKALADARRARGMSQQQLAERCRIIRSRLSDYERGVITPTPAMCRRLAEALGIDPATLMPGVAATTTPLAGLRIQAGLTQKEVGDAIGVTKVAVSQLETGLIKLSEPRARQLAELYHQPARTIVAAARRAERARKESQ